MENLSLADKINRFNRTLNYQGKLPPGIHIMNPFKENPEAIKVSANFYNKFYNDHNERKLILGINPGRFGAGVTGIPFTDTKRLEKVCGIEWEGAITHETSSVFVYDVIEKYGGTEQFYNNFFINSVSPLGFIIRTEKGKEKNYNYYDSKELLKMVEGFIIQSIRKIIDLGMKTKTCYCLGNNKNYSYLSKLNKTHRFFKNIEGLEHPRYIMQYRSKNKEYYINKYLDILNA